MPTPNISRKCSDPKHPQQTLMLPKMQIRIDYCPECEAISFQSFVQRISSHSRPTELHTPRTLRIGSSLDSSKSFPVDKFALGSCFDPSTILATQSGRN